MPLKGNISKQKYFTTCPPLCQLLLKERQRPVGFLLWEDLRDAGFFFNSKQHLFNERILNVTTLSILNNPV